ncbi:outer membrane beta-barrel protein [Psychromonas sp. PT13]|uniref:outer membrane beta-barrel protein n=1 Tax=Psychromonas sp. PT13 TaxID=3439547 RepID=UPI003EBEAF8A
MPIKQYRFTLSTLSLLISTGVQAGIYSPAPYELIDGFLLVPELTSSIVYDDNIYTSEVEKVSSYIYKISPSVKFGISNGIDEYGGTYTLSSGSYSANNDGDDDYIDHNLSLLAHKEFTDRHRLDIKLGMANTHEDRGSNTTDSSEYTYDEPLKYNSYTGSVYYEFGAVSAPMNIGGGIAYAQKVYQNFTDTTRYDDTATTTLSLDGAYKIGSVTDLTLSLSRADINYLHNESSTSKQDNIDNNVSIGLRWEGLAKTVGNINFGYQYKSYTDSAYENYDGTTINISIVWEPVTRSSFDLSLQRSAEDSSTFGDYSVSLDGSLDWKHSWSDVITSSIGFSYSDEDYFGSSIDREDITHIGSIGLSYDFARWVRFTTAYEYTDKSSSLSGHGYTQNSITLGISLSL